MTTVDDVACPHRAGDDPRAAERVVAESARAFSVFDPALAADPYPALGALRSRCPVARSDMFGGFWVVSRYEHIRRVLVDPVTYSSVETVIPWPKMDQRISNIPIAIDPPGHTAYRQILGRVFGPGRVGRLEPALRDHARGLITGMLAGGGPLDFRGDVAVPLSALALLELLGLPAGDLQLLLGFNAAILHDQFSPDPDVRAEFVRNWSPRIISYLEAAVRLRRDARFPPEDGLTDIVRSRFRGERDLSVAEIVSMVSLLIGTGIHTTRAELCLHVAHLGENPAQWRQLVDHPARIPAAVEEMLRAYSAITLSRVVTRDTELGGVPIRAGDRVQLLLPSAGRDDSVFPDAQEVRFDRGPTVHLAFGGGPHRCPGAGLARLTLRIVLEELSNALPAFRVASARRAFGLAMTLDELVLESGDPR
ncbi:cytochrome P450 [Pseudonocardia sp. GCM10023141]|uniref:cytochrome P450 n=1 Tax=Pseudonocardia sp. GCM10023141 TaxID=3252653 RepID=UPI0036081C9E